LRSPQRPPSGDDGVDAGDGAADADTPAAHSLSGRLRTRALRMLDHQVMRFALVGVVNSIFGFGVFAGLQISIGDHVHYLFLLMISHVVSVLEAYVLQRWLVFRVSGHWWRDLARFWSVYLVALAVNVVALPLLVEVVHLPVLLAQAIVMVGTALGSFIAHRTYSFRRPRASSELL
jgi:putative flippase GtrA